MLSTQELDILAVQEVRFEAGDHTHNQISDLASFLPGFQVYQRPHSSYLCGQSHYYSQPKWLCRCANLQSDLVIKELAYVV